MSNRVFIIALLIVFLNPVSLAASELDVCKDNANICKTDKKTKAKDKYPKYMKLQYNGEFFNNISATTRSNLEPFQFLLTYNNYGATKTSPAIPIKETDLESYNPNYWPVFSGSIVLGCSLFNNLRTPRLGLEMELLYSKIKVDDTDFTNKAAATYLVFSDRKEFALTTLKSRESFLNNGFTNFAGMFNIHYDWGYEDALISPYVIIGGGLTVMKFLGGVGGTFAYQVKAGLSYLISSHFEFFAGYRYFGTFDNRFKYAKPTNARISKHYDIPYPATNVLVNNTFGVHGLEVGLILNF